MKSKGGGKSSFFAAYYASAFNCTYTARYIVYLFFQMAGIYAKETGSNLWSCDPIWNAVARDVHESSLLYDLPINIAVLTGNCRNKEVMV